MSTEATQGMGADVADLESMFADEADDPVVENEAQTQTQTDTQTQQPNGDEANVNDDANPDNLEIQVDEDGNEIVIDPADADNQQNGELVIPDDHKVKLTIDGQEVEYSFADLKNSVQKGIGAERKFEEAAAIRKEYHEKAATLGEREQQLNQVLTHYIQQSQALMQSQEPNWVELMQNDPQKYLVERHNWEQKQLKLQQAAQIQANVQRQQADQQAALVHQRVQEAKTKLLAAIPEWNDPQKAAEGARALDQYLAKAGISEEMRRSIDSAEVTVIARKAMLYDQAIAAAQARKGGKPVTQQAASQPQRQQPLRQQGRVERPGAATQAQTAASRQNLARANAGKAFAANPTVDNLASFFE